MGRHVGAGGRQPGHPERVRGHRRQPGDPRRWGHRGRRTLFARLSPATTPRRSTPTSTLTDWPLADLRHAFVLDGWPVDGTVGLADLDLTGRYRAMFGAGRLRIDGGSAWHEKFDDGQRRPRARGHGPADQPDRDAQGAGAGPRGGADWLGRHLRVQRRRGGHPGRDARQLQGRAGAAHRAAPVQGIWRRRVRPSVVQLRWIDRRPVRRRRGHRPDRGAHRGQRQRDDHRADRWRRRAACSCT